MSEFGGRRSFEWIEWEDEQSERQQHARLLLDIRLGPFGYLGFALKEGAERAFRTLLFLPIPWFPGRNLEIVSLSVRDHGFGVGVRGPRGLLSGAELPRANALQLQSARGAFQAAAR